MLLEGNGREERLGKAGIAGEDGAAPTWPGDRGFFDGTITIAELIKWIWKGFRVGFGIGYEGPKNPLSEALNLWPNSSKNHMLFISAPFAFPLLHFPKPRGIRAQGPPLTCRNPRMMMPITPKPGFVSFADSALLIFTFTKGAAPGLSTGNAWLHALPFGRRRLPGGLFQSGIKKIHSWRLGPPRLSLHTSTAEEEEDGDNQGLFSLLFSAAATCWHQLWLFRALQPELEQ